MRAQIHTLFQRSEGAQGACLRQADDLASTREAQDALARDLDGLAAQVQAWRRDSSGRCASSDARVAGAAAGVDSLRAEADRQVRESGNWTVLQMLLRAWPVFGWTPLRACRVCKRRLLVRERRGACCRDVCVTRADLSWSCPQGSRETRSRA